MTSVCIKLKLYGTSFPVAGRGHGDHRAPSDHSAFGACVWQLLRVFHAAAGKELRLELGRLSSVTEHSVAGISDSSDQDCPPCLGEGGRHVGLVRLPESLSNASH